MLAALKAAWRAWRIPKPTKRPATKDEIARAMQQQIEHWNANNSDHIEPSSYWEGKQRAAIQEGYKSETCSCGVTYLAFHHFCTCRKEGCPFSDGVSLLDHMLDSLKSEETDA